jgi:alpha-N-arabinofuranosidase
VNVIGAIKTSKTAAALETTGLVLNLYRNHFGQIPLAVSGQMHGLDVAAAWTADRKAITIGIANPNPATYHVDLMLKGAALAGTGRCWTIAHSDPMAYNDPGHEPRIAIEEQAISDTSGILTAPGYGVRVYELAVR